MSQIISFYSYKGGVGRTFALANVAALLARKGNRVLIMDWDLEAPGLDYYLKPYYSDSPQQKGGIIGLLTESRNNQNVFWQPYIQTVSLKGHTKSSNKQWKLDYISSGIEMEGYTDKVRDFSWNTYFSEHKGGRILERWRDEWKNEYEFILIDSRTGITDIGGVCTVLLPDILALVFVANHQSFDNAVRIAKGMPEARVNLKVVREKTMGILPLFSRFHRTDEYKEGEEWINRVAEEMAFIYETWPTQPEPMQMVEATYIPYVPFYSFGEPMPVVNESLTDTALPGHRFENITTLFASDFRDAQQIIAQTKTAKPVETQVDAQAKVRDLLTQSFIDENELVRLVSLAERQAQNEYDCVDLLFEAGKTLRERGSFERAEKLLSRVLRLHEQRLGENDPVVARDIDQLALLLEASDRLKEAEPLLRRALKINEYHYGSANPSCAPLLQRLASILLETEHTAEAETVLRRLLGIDEQYYGKSHPTVSRDLNNLALLLLKRSDLLEAEGLAGNPSLLLKAAEFRLEARRMLERALNIDKHHFSPRHPEVANDLNNLAQAMKAIGRLKDAERWLRLALQIDEQYPERDEAKIALRLSNLGSLMYSLDRTQEAEELMRRALLLDESRLGRSHPALADRLNNLAALLVKIGKPEDAEPLLRRALMCLFRVSHSHGHPAPRLRDIFTNYIDLLREMSWRDDQISQKLSAISQESGYDEEGFKRLRVQLLS